MKKQERIAAFNEACRGLEAKLDELATLSDLQLFAKAKAQFTILSEATRDECVKMLVMGYVIDNFGRLVRD